MATWSIIAAALVVVGATAWAAVQARTVASVVSSLRDDYTKQPPTPAETSPPAALDESVTGWLQELDDRTSQLERRTEELTIAVAEGIKHVERAENRIKATISRARKELEENGVESPGLEAEARELQLFDDGGGPGEGVPAVSQGMVPAESSIPGVTVEQLRRARMM